MPFSDEILTEKTEMDEIYSIRDQRMTELTQWQDSSQLDVNEKTSTGD